jgi:hypothetical protein
MGPVESVTTAGLRLPSCSALRARCHSLEPMQLGLSEMPLAICYGQRLGQQRAPLALPYRCRGLSQQGQTIRLKHYCSRGSPRLPGPDVDHFTLEPALEPNHSCQPFQRVRRDLAADSDQVVQFVRSAPGMLLTSSAPALRET